MTVEETNVLNMEDYPHLIGRLHRTPEPSNIPHGFITPEQQSAARAKNKATSNARTIRDYRIKK
jgi:hypothetical protein